MAKIGFGNGVFTSQGLIVDPQAVADGFVQYSESGVSKWKHGNKTSDSSWRLSKGSALGTNDALNVTSNMALLLPKTPCFSACMAVDQTDCTGDGTLVDVLFGTELYDYGSNYDPVTGLFTAPETAGYLFNCYLQYGDLGAGHTTGKIQFAASSGSTRFPISANFGAMRTAANTLVIGAISQTIRLTAGQTMKVQTAVSGSTLTVDLLSATFQSVFEGFLIG